MDTCIKNYVEEKTKELIAAPSCYQGLRDLAEKWLNSKDTPEEAKANGAKYCICPACTAGGAILDKKDEILK